MKTLKQHIEEKLIINKDFKYINNYFLYKIDKEEKIKIFHYNWTEWSKYIHNVYINGEHINLDGLGRTEKIYKPGTYEVKIKDIDDITNCGGMFSYCNQLINVPLFDTSKVINMRWMFSDCFKLEEVPLFDTSKVKDMEGMFGKCYNLSDETKELWTTIYDFENDDKRK